MRQGNLLRKRNSRIAVRSSRACGVKLTLKLEISQYLFDGDHRGAVLHLSQPAFDLRALPRIIPAFDRAIAFIGFKLWINVRFHADWVHPITVSRNAIGFSSGSTIVPNAWQTGSAALRQDD